MILSSDKKYMFTAGEDSYIILWYTEEWQMLCKILTDFPI